MGNHIKNVHSNEKRFSCCFCEEKFKLKKSLKQHEQKICPIKLNLAYKCDQCNQCFSGQNTLSNHVKIHARKTKFAQDKCQICSKLLLAKNMKKHLDTHSTSV